VVPVDGRTFDAVQPSPAASVGGVALSHFITATPAAPILRRRHCPTPVDLHAIVDGAMENAGPENDGTAELGKTAAPAKAVLHTCPTGLYIFHCPRPHKWDGGKRTLAPGQNPQLVVMLAAPLQAGEMKRCS